MKLYLLVITIIITLLLSAAQSEWGELKGVVTYKTDYGSSTDAGAEVIVYFIDSVKFPTDKYHKERGEDSLINNSLLATIYYAEWKHTPIGRVQREMIRKLKGLNAYPEEKLMELDDLAAKIISERENRHCAKTTVDGKGNYSVKLHSGYYGIIFRSKHLHNNSKAETNGDIMLDNALIKPGGITKINEEML